LAPEAARPLVQPATLSLGANALEVQHDLARESRLSAVFASLAEGVVIQDLQGRIVDCNASAERILGLGREQILSRTSLDPFWRTLCEDGSDFPGEQHPAAVTLRTGEPQVDVVMGLCKPDGSVTWLSINSQPLRASSGAAAEGVVVSFCDITTVRCMAERLLEAQKLESVARLAGGVAHDFNNLLTAVLGYAELCLNLAPPQSALAGHLAQIIRSGDRAADLTRQLLDFARRRPPRIEQLDLRDLLGENLEILRSWVGSGIAVECSCAPQLWPVHADRGQLRQLLLNLASNAADAMPEGGTLALSLANVVLEAGAEHGAGDFVELRVSDSGAGMATHVLSHVFEPFFSTKQVGEGSGLGLASCYGIVRQHRGSISVRSTRGEGTSFTIHLPRALELPA